jgi:SAM-dependent methyltransferase
MRLSEPGQTRVRGGALAFGPIDVPLSRRRSAARVFGNIPRGHAGASIASAPVGGGLALYRSRPEDSVMAGMLYDNKAAVQLEQAYATTDMIVQREELRRSLRASAGESILDLGSGPGFLAFELAQEVGATGRIVAVDISSDMNSIASKRIAPPARRPGRHLGGRRDRACVCRRGLRGRCLDAGHRVPRRAGRRAPATSPRPATRRTTRDHRHRLGLARLGSHGSPPRCSDRGRVEQAPARPLPSALARAPLGAAGFEVREIRIVPILNTAYDATTSATTSPRSSRIRARARGVSKTRQPNGSTTSQNFNTKGSTSLASIDTCSPRRVPERRPASATGL